MEKRMLVEYFSNGQVVLVRSVQEDVKALLAAEIADVGENVIPVEVVYQGVKFKAFLLRSYSLLLDVLEVQMHKKYLLEYYLARLAPVAEVFYSSEKIFPSVPRDSQTLRLSRGAKKCIVLKFPSERWRGK